MYDKDARVRENHDEGVRAPYITTLSSRERGSLAVAPPTVRRQAVCSFTEPHACLTVPQHHMLARAVHPYKAREMYLRRGPPQRDQKVRPLPRPLPTGCPVGHCSQRRPPSAQERPSIEQPASGAVAVAHVAIATHGGVGRPEPRWLTVWRPWRRGRSRLRRHAWWQACRRTSQ